MSIILLIILGYLWWPGIDNIAGRPFPHIPVLHGTSSSLNNAILDAALRRPRRGEAHGRAEQSTADTGIFSPDYATNKIYHSMTYLGERCLVYTTTQGCTQLIHAKFTHSTRSHGGGPENDKSTGPRFIAAAAPHANSWLASLHRLTFAFSQQVRLAPTEHHDRQRGQEGQAYKGCT